MYKNMGCYTFLSSTTLGRKENEGKKVDITKNYVQRVARVLCFKTLEKLRCRSKSVSSIISMKYNKPIHAIKIGGQFSVIMRMIKKKKFDKISMDSLPMMEVIYD